MRRPTTLTLCPRPPVCAPPLSGAPETVTPSDTSMSVRGREWHQYVGVCGEQRRERGRRGKGLSARRRTGCRPAEDQQVDTFPPFPRGVVTVLARKEKKRRREGEAARDGGASGRRERAAREEASKLMIIKDCFDLEN